MKRLIWGISAGVRGFWDSGLHGKSCLFWYLSIDAGQLVVYSWLCQDLVDGVVESIVEVKS